MERTYRTLKQLGKLLGEEKRPRSLSHWALRPTYIHVEGGPSMPSRLFKKPGVVALVLPLAVVVALQGCGGSSSGGSLAAAGGGSCTLGQGVTTSQITFGQSTALTGPISAVGLSRSAALGAFDEMVNAAGGIDGRKLQTISLDDQFSEQMAVTNTQELIQRDKVFAIWGGTGDSQIQAADQISEAAKIPMLFPLSFASTVAEPVKPYTFSIDADTMEQGKALSDWMATQPQFKNAKVGGLFINTEPIQPETGFKEGAEGSHFVKMLTYDSASSSGFTPQLTALKDAGVNVLYVSLTDAAWAQALQEAGQIGFKATWLDASDGETSQLFKLAGSKITGQYVYSYLQADTSSVPGAVSYRAAMAKYEPNAPLSASGLDAWAGALIVKAALEKVGACLNQAALVAALNSIKDFSPGGLTPLQTFSSTEHLGSTEMFTLQAKNGEWTTVGKAS
jgi:ABC-type branched-subunit amino acid transport system substrate-binding protein